MSMNLNKQEILYKYKAKTCKTLSKKNYKQKYGNSKETATIIWFFLSKSILWPPRSSDLIWLLFGNI